MHPHKYKYQTKHNDKQPQVYIRSSGKPRVTSPPQSPRSRNNAPPYPKEHYFTQRQQEYNLSPRGRYTTGSGLSQGQDRMKVLINEVLNSADAVAAQLLRYDNSQEESLCSRYFLKRQKLTTYMNSDRNLGFQGFGSKASKKYCPHKSKRRSSEDDLGDSQVTPDQLARLEDIVYGKVIPILQTDFECQRKMVENTKKHKQYKQSDLNEGLMLLEKLQNKKNSVGFDGYVQVLEKFIRRVMDKEESLMNKLFKLQQKLEKQMEKTQKLSKERQRKDIKREARISSKDANTTETYKNFVKQIKTLLKDNKTSSSSEQSLAVELDILTARTKTMINTYPQSSKEIHRSCKQELKKSQEQIKSLKIVVKKLDAEVENLKHQCESLEEKMVTGSDKLWKFEQKFNKIHQENNELKAQIEVLEKDITYKNHLIGQYLGIIGKLEDHIKMKDQNESQLEIQNQRHMENINMKNQGYERLLKHVEQIQQRNKELEEREEEKDRQLQETLKQLYVKQFEVTHITSTHQRICHEYEQVKLKLQEKEEEAAMLQEQLKMLRGSTPKKPMMMGLISKASQTYESYESSPTFNNPSNEQIYKAAYPPIRDQLLLGLNITNCPSETRSILREDAASQVYDLESEDKKQEKKEQKGENVKKQEEKGQEKKKSSDDEDDIQVLKQTIKLLQQGLKNSHKQVEELTYQNKILLSHNQALYNANLPNYMMGFPLDKTLYSIAAFAVDGLNTPQPQFQHNNRNQRPDFIPAHINRKKLVQEIFKMVSQQKEQPHNLAEEINEAQETGEFKQPSKNNISENDILHYNTDQEEQARRNQQDLRRTIPPNSQQQSRRGDFDPGHRAPLEQSQEEKKRRGDWDPGHRVPNLGSEQDHQNKGNQDIAKQNRQLKNIVRAKDKFIELMQAKNIELEEQLEKLKKQLQKRPPSQHNLLTPNPFNVLAPGSLLPKQPQPSTQLQSSTDLTALQQSNKMLSINLANAQIQIERLTTHNKILLSHNEALYKANLLNYLQGFPIQTALEGVAAAIPVDDGLQSSGSYSGNNRPDFIPSHTNKDIAEGTIKYLGNTGNKDDVSQQNSEKKRRVDWDAGHRAPLEAEQSIQNQITQPNNTAQNPEEDQQPETRRSDLDNIEAVTENNQQAREDANIEVKEEEQIHQLIDELSKQKEPSLSQIQKSIHSSRQRNISATIDLDSDRQLIKIQEKKDNKEPVHQLSQYIHIKEEPKGSSFELSPEVIQHYKIRQMIEHTERVKQKLIEVKKQTDNSILIDEIKIILDEVQQIHSLLIICKKNTISKLKKLIRIQSEKKEAEEQNQRLQMKLEAASHLFSNITPISQGSGMNFEEHLQQIMKTKAINDDQILRRDTLNSLDLKPQSQRSHKQLVDECTQTQYFTGILLQSQVKKYLPQLRKMMTSQSAVNNSLLNRSFIDDLQQLTSDRLPYSQRMSKLESMVQDWQQLNQTSPVKSNNIDKNGSEEDLHRSRVRMDNQISGIDNWIGLHKEQIFNLHKLLKKTASLPPKFGEESEPQSPVRRPILQNDQYIAVINNAPKKENQQSQSNGQQEKQKQKIQSLQIQYLKQIKDMFKSRQNQFTAIISQKEQEINRLMSIVEKLSENPLKEAKMTPRQSRHIDSPNHQIQELKNKIADLQIAFEIMKTENERLRVQRKQNELRQELSRLKQKQEGNLQSKSNVAEAIDHTNLQEKHKQIKECQNFVVANEQQARSEMKGGDAVSPTIRIHSEIVKQGNLQQGTKDKGKRFERRTFHYRQNSSKSPQPQSPRSPAKFDTKLQELMPEFFGKKKPRGKR